MSRPFVTLDDAENFLPINFGKLQVKQNNPGLKIKRPVAIPSTAKNEVQGLLAIANDVNFVCHSVMTKSMNGQLNIGRIILNQQNRYLTGVNHQSSCGFGSVMAPRLS